MASKREDLERGFNELVKNGADLPEGPGKDLILSAITDAKNSIEVILDPEGRLNVDAMLTSKKAFKRLMSDPTNGTSWCC